MRKLILQMQSSVDGFISRENGSLDWLLWDFSDQWSWDQELKRELNAIFESVDGIVLSGRMADEGYIDHWSNMCNRHPQDPDFVFTKIITNSPKFVFSKKLKESRWPDTVVINENLIESLKRFKSGIGNDLITFGGATFAATLLHSALVDELQLFVNPKILGSGVSIFSGLHSLSIDLITSKAYTCGITVLKYQLL